MPWYGQQDSTGMRSNIVYRDIGALMDLFEFAKSLSLRPTL